MAVLNPQTVSLVRIRLFDFKQRVENIRKTINDQVFSGFSFTPNQRAIKARYEQADFSLNQNLNRLAGAIASGSLDGELLTSQNVGEIVRSFEGDLTTMQKAMGEWNASSPLGVVMGTLGNIFGSAFDSLNSITSVVGTTSAFLTWLPWIIVGAIVIPPVLRIIIKARKGGVDAALQEANDSIEAGKDRAKKAAGTAARTAVTAAKFLI